MPLIKSTLFASAARRGPVSTPRLLGKRFGTSTVLKDKLVVEASGNTQSPLNLLWVAGPWTPIRWFLPIMQNCSKAGYGSVAVDLWSDVEDHSISSLIRRLETMMGRTAFPPVLISHGLGSLVAQYYLEDFPAKGLAMLSPFPAYEAQSMYFNQSNRESLGGYLLTSETWRAAQEQDNYMHLLNDERLLQALVDDRNLVDTVASQSGACKVSFGIFEKISRNVPKFEAGTGLPMLIVAPRDDLLVTATEIDLVCDRYELDAEAGDVVAVDGPHLGFLKDELAQQYAMELCSWLDNCVY